MNLLENPNLWSSSPGGSAPPDSWQGTAFKLDNGPAEDTALNLYLLAPYAGSADIVHGFAQLSNGESVSGTLELRDSVGSTLDSVSVPQDGAAVEFNFNVPEGVLVSLAFIGGGYDGDYLITPAADSQVLVANNDTASTPYNTPVAVNVLANDTLDGVAPVSIDDVTMSITVQAANGTASINPNGSVTYTPNPGFYGTDTFTYNIELLPSTCLPAAASFSEGMTLYLQPFGANTSLDLVVTLASSPSDTNTFTYYDGSWNPTGGGYSFSEGDEVNFTQDGGAIDLGCGVLTQTTVLFMGCEFLEGVSNSAWPELWIDEGFITESDSFSFVYDSTTYTATWSPGDLLYAISPSLPSSPAGTEAHVTGTWDGNEAPLVLVINCGGA